MQKANLSHHGEPGELSATERLDSWKEIAAYLKRDIRTLHRWERDEGLPVHRHLHKKRDTVYAYKSELDAWWKNRSSRPQRMRRNMLAVLPFDNLSGDSGQDYFSDGLTEEMITQLGSLHPEGLGVIARISVMQYKGAHKTLEDVGRELGADYVLEGSVRRKGEQVRITAQLIRVSDQTHLWAESYDRILSDVLTVQAEVAQAMVQKVGLQLTPQEQDQLNRPRRVNPEAFEAYLKGRFHWYKLSREHLDIALGYFQLALEKDPNYALAHAGVAYVWFSRGDCGLLPPREVFPEAKAAALKAIGLDDTLPETHELLANVRRHYEWDWPGAEAEFRRAIQLNPNTADGHFMYADFLISLGRMEEARAEMEQAMELDPFNSFYQCFLAWHLLYLGRSGEAIGKLRKVLEAEPNFPAARLGLWGAFYQKRIYDDALAEAQKFFFLLGDREVAEALACGCTEASYRRGMSLAAETLAARSKSAYVPAIRIARLYAHAREKERALEWLEKAYQEREPPLVHLGVSWDWDGLRDDPRFQALLHRMNLPQ